LLAILNRKRAERERKRERDEYNETLWKREQRERREERKNAYLLSDY
jgi:hypothetical protein